MYIKWIIRCIMIASLLNLSSPILAQNPMAPASRVLNIQHWETAQGVPVYFVQAQEIPMMDIQLVFRAGSGYDGNKHGLANLTSSLMNEGAAGLSADQIAEKFDAAGAIFNASV